MTSRRRTLCGQAWEQRYRCGFLRTPTLATGRWSFLLTAAVNGTVKKGRLVRERRQRSGASDLRFSVMFERGIEAVQTEGVIY